MDDNARPQGQCAHGRYRCPVCPPTWLPKPRRARRCAVCSGAPAMSGRRVCAKCSIGGFDAPTLFEEEGAP
jgi:hypothetical protein